MGKKAAPPPPPPPPEEPKEEEEEEEKPVGEQLNGDFIFQDGSTYKGQYLKVGEDVLLHGRGLLLAGPEAFQGTFEKGLYKYGRYTSCNGAVYKGNFRENLFHGLGEYTWPDGRSYKGTWKDGKMHGRGQFLNFIVGERIFSGFSLHGDFKSAPLEQAGARSAFLDVYEAECVASATAAVRDLASRTGSNGPPRKFMVPPGETSTPDEKPSIAIERDLVAAAVLGPFPAAGDMSREAVQAFAAGLAEDAEKPLAVTVYRESPQPGLRLEAKRLRLPQLQCVGQAVEVALPPELAKDAEAGSLAAVVLVNVSKEYDFALANWKLVHAELVPPPAE